LAELARGDLEVEVAIPSGVVEPVEVLDIFFAPSELVGYKALPPVVSRGGCKFDVTELVKEICGVVKVSEGFGVAMNKEGFDVGGEPLLAVGLFNVV
jgi:hypothetical protein